MVIQSRPVSRDGSMSTSWREYENTPIAIDAKSSIASIRPMVFTIEGGNGRVTLKICTPLKVLHQIELEFGEMRDLHLALSKALWHVVGGMR